MLGQYRERGSVSAAFFTFKGEMGPLAAVMWTGNAKPPAEK
jgi:hypothetical protein